MTRPPSDKWTRAEIKAVGDPLVQPLKDVERALVVLKNKKSAWHKSQHDALTRRAATVLQEVKQLQQLINTPKETGKRAFDPARLTKEVTDLHKAATDAVAQQVEITYYFGPTKVANQNAVEAKAKESLPEADKKHASQAVTDAVNGQKAKDAAVAGPRVKHASAGVKGVGSCTIFFTWEEHRDGLEQRFVVVAVGGHAGASSYQIHETFTSRLKVGSTVSL